MNEHERLSNELVAAAAALAQFLASEDVQAAFIRGAELHVSVALARSGVGAVGVNLIENGKLTVVDGPRTFTPPVLPGEVH